MQLLTVTETGYGRRSKFEDYRVQGRAGKGIINYYTDKYGKVAMIAPVMEENDVIMITSDGIVIRTHADQISSINRGGKGVKVMSVKDGEKVATIGIVERANDEDNSDEDVQTETETEGSEKAPENE